jgi:hypothetical protein
MVSIVSKAAYSWQHFSHDDLLFRDIAHLKSLLDKARTILILTKLNDMAFDLPHGPVSVLCQSEFFKNMTGRWVRRGLRVAAAGAPSHVPPPPSTASPPP